MDNISKVNVNGTTYGLTDTTARASIETETARAMAAEALLQSIYQGLTNNGIEVVDELPNSGTADTVYRIIGTSSYSDYMYVNDEWVLLATYTGQPTVFVHLTQAEYDALTSLEKNNGTYYFVEEE